MASPRILRIIILLLAVAACASLVYDRQVYDIDRFNGYLSFALMGSYFFSLVCQYRLVNMYTRAFLMILLAFVWLTVNTRWTYTRYIHDRDIFRTDVSFSFPTSLLVIFEAILTLRYQSQLTRALQDQESGYTALSNPPPTYRQTQEMSIVSVLPAAVLPLDEQDNVEITISPVDTPASTLSRAAGHGEGKGHIRGAQHRHHQLPTHVYFPPSSSPSSSSPSPSSTSSSSQSRRNRVLPMAEILSPEDLPPYSHV